MAALTWSALAALASGAVLLALGAACLLLPRRDARVRLLGSGLILWAAQIGCANVAGLVEAPESARLLYFASIALLVPLPAWFARFATSFPKERAGRGVAPFALAVGLAAALVLVMRPGWMLAGVEPYAPQRFAPVWGPALPWLVTLPFFAALAFALAALTRAATTSTGGLSETPAFLASGIGVYLAFTGPGYLTFYARGLAIAPEPGLVANVLTFGAVTAAYFFTLVEVARTRSWPARPLVLGLLLLAAANGVLVNTIELDDSNVAGAVAGVGLWRLLGAALIVWALARRELPRFDLRLAPALRMPLVAAILGTVGLFLVGAMQALAQPEDRLAIWTTAAAGLVGAIIIARPVARLSARQVPPDTEYVYQRKVEVYRAHLEEHLATGARPEDEEWLSSLRASLGITEREDRLLRHVVSHARDPVPAARTGVLLHGRYRVERELASGGSGRALLGFDTSLRRRVVVKEFGAAGTDDVVAEARRLARLNHPHIVTVHEVYDAGPRSIVMEYCEGGSLDSLLRGTGPVGVDSALRIFRDALRGLEAAHAAGILHRDVKPANILLTRDGRAKIADLGASVEIDVASAAAGDHPGTLMFMSPEQAAGERLDERSDIYSLGASLYWSVTGSSHLGTADPRASLARGAGYTPHPAIPAALGAWLSGALAARPEDRFPTAAAARQALPAPPEVVVGVPTTPARTGLHGKS